jgi:hypothetical protein
MISRPNKELEKEKRDRYLFDLGMNNGCLEI